MTVTAPPTPEPTRPRRRRRLLRIALTGGTVVLLLGTATVAAAWFGVAQGIEPNHPAPDGSVEVLAVDPGSVTLPADERTARPGHWGLSWGGGSAVVGEVLDRGPGTVRRALDRGTVPSVGSYVRLTDSFQGDPRTATGLDFSEIMVGTPLGPAPAWYVPAAGPRADTMAIVVHGTNASRKAGLRFLPTLHAAGLPVLLISQRNDVGAPPSPDGLMHLGESEWQDLEAAVRTARSLGARHVLLYGASGGAAIVGRFMAYSPQATTVSAVVFDSPLVSIPATARFTIEDRLHLPGVVTSVGKRIFALRTGVDMDRIDLLTHPPAVRPTTLLMAGGADEEAPVQAMRDLAAAGPRLGWPIRYEEFPGAGHNLSWNSDPVRYERVLAGFLESAVPAGR